MSIGSTGAGNAPVFCPTTDEILAAKQNLKSDSRNVKLVPDVQPQLPSALSADSIAGDKQLSDRKAEVVNDASLPSLSGENKSSLLEKKAAAMERASVAQQKLEQSTLMELAQKLLKGEKVDGEQYKGIVISVIIPPSTEPISVHPPASDVDKKTMSKYQEIALQAFDKFKTDPRNDDYNRDKLEAELEEVKVELRLIHDELIVQGEEELADWEDEFNALHNRDASFHIKDDDGHQVITSTSNSTSSTSPTTEEDIDYYVKASDIQDDKGAPSWRMA